MNDTVVKYGNSVNAHKYITIRRRRTFLKKHFIYNKNPPKSFTKELRLACSLTQLCQYGIFLLTFFSTTTCFGLYRPLSGCLTRVKCVLLILSSYSCIARFASRDLYINGVVLCTRWVFLVLSISSSARSSTEQKRDAPHRQQAQTG